MKKENIKTWISAFRLRTLALSLSLIGMGSALAYQHACFNAVIFALAITTTLFLQILSNISNDYGDAVSGADFAGRVGPERAVQSGAISREAMLRAIYVLSAFSLVSGIVLLWAAWERITTVGCAAMFGVGIGCIASAICYTVGRRPYGYRGLGDVSVFVFFGIVGVQGSFLLFYGEPLWSVMLPASAVGLLSMGVLNMNNMRDMQSDQRSGKVTLVVRFGLTWARRYQVTCITLAFAAMVAYIVMFGYWWQMLSMAVLPIFIKHLHTVLTTADNRLLDPQLKVVSVGTMIMVLLFTAGTLIAC